MAGTADVAAPARPLYNSRRLLGLLPGSNPDDREDDVRQHHDDQHPRKTNTTGFMKKGAERDKSHG